MINSKTIKAAIVSLPAWLESDETGRLNSPKIIVYVGTFVVKPQVRPARRN